MESLQRVANRGSVSTGPYQIDNSYKNEADNTERMYRPWGAGGGNSQTFTVSLWVKRTELDTQQYIWGAGTGGTNFFLVSFESDNTMRVRSHVSSSDQAVYITNRLFRDTSAWYHIVTAVDTTNGTAGDRLRIYINGVEETSFSTETNFSQNDSTMHNANSSYMEIGTVIGEANRFCGYISEVISISGSQLAPTTFGEFDSDTGIWIPIEYTGSFPQNSVFLEFKDSSSLGTDTSGNGQTFTLQNITAADQATDTPTNNFAIINRLFKYPSSQVINEGATKVARSSGSGLNKTFISTIAVTAGKWYAEFKPTAGGSNYVVGIMPIDTASTVDLDSNHLGNGDYAGSLGYYSAGGSMLAAGNSANGSFGNSYTGDDIIGVALDMDNRKVYFSKNGTYQNSQDPTNGTNAITLTDTSDGYHIGFTYDTSGTVECNFGGYHVNTLSSAAADENGFGSFEYAPPTGYLALSTQNLGSDGG
tara:strand:- start:1421 stop:2848 length:1428 start_codon:yes stop_codon:yes gene_type:complete